MIEFIAVAVAILWLVVLVPAAAMIELVRQIGQLRKQTTRQAAAVIPDEGLTPGTTAPLLEKRALSGRVIGDLENALILFLSPDCSLCKAVASGISDIELDLRTKVIAVVQGSESDVERFTSDHHMPRHRTVADPEATVRNSFNISTTPTALVIREGRVWKNGVVNTADQAAAFYALAMSRSEVGHDDRAIGSTPTVAS